MPFRVDAEDHEGRPASGVGRSGGDDVATRHRQEVVDLLGPRRDIEEPHAVAGEPRIERTVGVQTRQRAALRGPVGGLPADVDPAGVRERDRVRGLLLGEVDEGEPVGAEGADGLAPLVQAEHERVLGRPDGPPADDREPVVGRDGDVEGDRRVGAERHPHPAVPTERRVRRAVGAEAATATSTCSSVVWPTTTVLPAWSTATAFATDPVLNAVMIPLWAKVWGQGSPAAAFAVVGARPAVNVSTRKRGTRIQEERAYPDLNRVAAILWRAGAGVVPSAVVFEFRILGPFVVLQDGSPVVIPGGMERATLAMLLLSAGQVVSSDHLIDALWESEPPTSARNSLHVRIAGLRKSLGSDRIESRPPGYVIRVEPGELDLERFEHLILRGDAEDLREALALWRGAALEDFARDRWATSAIARLEEMRLLAIERLADIDLELGRHAELVGQLQAELVDHPFRERLRAQLMLALYRSGRQADALAEYRAGRAVMVEQLGIEPYPAMQELEQAILRQDPALDLGTPGEVERSILVAALDARHLSGLTEIAVALARRSRRTLILTRPIDPEGDLADATAALHAESERLVAAGTATRAAAFRSGSPGRDVAGFAAEQDVDLVLVDGSAALLDDPEIADLLDASPCDVAVVSGGEVKDGAVVVPFIGADHDWSAVELGAWLASARDGNLTLVGPTDDQRDSSRLLASASIAVQRALGVTVVPVVISPDADDLLEVANEASVVAVGVSDRWRTEGLGPVRSALATRAVPPVILVHRGLRPGGLAPPDGVSRFTWSIRIPG